MDQGGGGIPRDKVALSCCYFLVTYMNVFALGESAISWGQTMCLGFHKGGAHYGCHLEWDA